MALGSGKRFSKSKLLTVVAYGRSIRIAWWAHLLANLGDVRQHLGLVLVLVAPIHGPSAHGAGNSGAPVTA